MSENPEINSSKLLVVVTSLPDTDVAKLLARAVIERNLAACVQLTAGVDSIYRWQGKICEEREVLLSVKTTLAKWGEISALIKDKHPYDIPEILAFSPEQCDQQYSKWVQSEVNSKT